MADALRELIAFFGVEVDDKQLHSSQKKMKEWAETAEKAAAIVGVALAAKEIYEFITSQIELGTEVLHTSEMLGLATDELQKFRFEAASVGVGGEEATTALRFLNKNLGEAAEGAGTAGHTLAKLGVQLRDQAGQTRPAIDVLGDVADAFSTMEDPAKKTAIAMDLFGRAGARMIPLLNKGGKGIEELSKDFDALGGGLNKEFLDATEKSEEQLNRLHLASRGMVAVIASAMLPAFTDLVHWVTDIVAGFREFTSHSYIVQTALGTLAAAAVVLAVIWGVLNIEVLLVVGAIALAILIIDDVYTAMKGGKSVIGDFIDSIFGIGTTKKVFDDLKEWAADAYKFLKALLDIKNELSGHPTNQGPQSPEQNAADDARMRKILAARGFSMPAETDVPTAADVAPYRDETQRGPAYPGAGGFSMIPIEPLGGASPRLPGAPAQVVQHGDVTNHNEVTVQVQGGSSPRETGKIVGTTAADVINDANQAAYAGLPGGGGH